MAKRTSAVDLPALDLRAEIVPSSIDEEKRTVEVVWTTGARVERGYFERYWEELSLDPKHVRMGRLNAGAPLLNSHDATDLRGVLGVVESAVLQKTKGTARVRFAKAEDDPAAEQIFRKVKDKIITNVSVGYRIHKMEKVEETSDKIPVYRAVDWEPYEISMVPIGADAGAGVRSGKADLNKCVFTRGEQTMDDEKDDVTVAKTLKPESAAVAATRAASVARIEDAKARAAEREAGAQEALAAERERSTGIRTVGRQAKMPESWVNACIDGGVSVEEARKAAFEEIARRDSDDGSLDFPSGCGFSAGDDARDKFIRGASAWLFERTGTRKQIEAAAKKNPEAFKDVSFDPGEFRGMTPVDLARFALERGGVKTRGMDRMKLVGAAFTQRAANYQTIGDFPTLLENVLGKVLLGAYATQANTWERICKVDEVPDFRTSNRYRTGSLTGLDVIPEHGEYQNGTVPDGSKYPVATQRMGKIFGLSRETIINDDMSALTDMSTKMGQAAMRSLENAVYALILQNSGLGPNQGDGQPFFHANRSNVNAVGSGLSVAGIDADRTVLGNQKDPAGLDFLDLNPAILLVPLALRGTGLEVNDAQFDFDNAGTNTTGKFMRPNKVRGLFREVVASPRITGTRRYIIADPLDWIVVAFLEGYGRGPTLESQDGWRIDGTEWKVTLYAKPQMGDPKAAVTNAGT